MIIYQKTWTMIQLGFMIVMIIWNIILTIKLFQETT